MNMDNREQLEAAYRDLQARAAALEQENQLLQRAGTTLEQENQLLQRELEVLRYEYQQRLAEIEELKREIFGPKADRLTPEEQKQLVEVVQDLVEQDKRPRPLQDEVLIEELTPGRPPRPRRRRHPLPLQLETETVTLKPDLDACPLCGRTLERIGEEVTEELDFIPARLVRRRIVRPKYACRCGEAGVTVAPLPPRLIPQRRLGLGLAVYIVLARFDDHLSFYRLAQKFQERYGVEIPRQQMVQWVVHIARWLEAVYQVMWKGLLLQDYLQIDETPVRVLDPEVKGKAARGYLWFYAVPGGDVLLAFDRSRGQAPPQQRLQGFRGTIQTDAYEVYKTLQRTRPGLKRIGCLAHVRRRFYTAARNKAPFALWFISQIRLLYQIEDEARGLPPQDRLALRRARAPVIWRTMKVKAKELRPTLLPESSMGKAVNYFLKEYRALVGYRRDGRFEIDNNLVENAIRPAAVGRKRWLFIGHPGAGWRSAVIYSLIHSCRRRRLNPHDYLTDVLRRLPSMKMNEIAALLPENWKPHPPDTG
jgi:transposase